MLFPEEDGEEEDREKWSRHWFALILSAFVYSCL